LRLTINARTILWIIAAAAAVVFRRPVLLSASPLLIGLLLANLIEPAVALLEKRTRLSRAVAAGVVIALLVLVFGYVGTLVVTQIANELIELSRLLPAHQQAAMDLFNAFLAWSQGVFQGLPDEVQAYLQENVQNLSGRATELAGAVINRVLTTILGVPTAVLVLVFGILAAFFASKDLDLVHRTLLQVLPSRWRQTMADARDKILVDLGRFFKAYFVLFIISAVQAVIGLSLIDAKYWIVLSLLMAALDSIPIVGPGFILVPWAAWAFYTGAVTQAVILFALFVIMFVVRQALQPKLLGDSVGVHPLTMLVALWAGIVTVGVWGIIVGPVVVIVAKAAHNAGLFRFGGDPGTEANEPSGGADGHVGGDTGRADAPGRGPAQPDTGSRPRGETDSPADAAAGAVAAAEVPTSAAAGTVTKDGADGPPPAP